MFHGLGSMLDYAVNSCGEDLRLFYARFLSSGVAAQIERGNPRYLCGLSGVELAMTAAVRSGTTLRSIRAYEQAQLGLSNASAESIIRLSRVLGCTPSDLLD